MNNTYLGKVNTSLVHFLILTIFGASTALFLVHKADQAISDFDSISGGPYMTQLRQAASTQGTMDTTGWKTYRNEKYRFEVKYPENWKLKFEEPNIEFTNSKGYVHGLGVPDFGEMSFTIIPEIKTRGVTCQATQDYSTSADWPGLWPMEKTFCLNGVEIILEYTDSYHDSLTSIQVKNNKKLLEEIFSTFRFIK